MNTKLFVYLCTREVIEDTYKRTGTNITEDDVYVVWQCKTLQNNKALLSTSLRDGVYYEFTCDGNNERIYMDVYEKVKNSTILI